MRGRLLIIAVLAGLVLPGGALAAWNASGTSVRGYAKAANLNAGNQPTVAVTGRNATVSWTATGGSVPVGGYVVKRYNTSGVAQTIGAACNGTVGATSCTEAGVPSGTWRYSVTPARQGWRGAESPQSANAVVGSPALTLAPTSLGSLPATLTGQITNYVSGQTVTFRLDDQASGTLLDGSITPSSVPSNGTANVSVTLPAGTSSGSHTIFAVGNQGDVAGASVTVTTPQTLTTSAWDLGDASAGGAEVDRSDPSAFADGITVSTSAPQTSFNAARYLSLDYVSPLPTNATPTTTTFDIRFAASNPARTVCFYFEVRRASTNAVVATHGSAASPVGCVTGTAQTAFSTPLPEVTSRAIANDLRVRAYMRSTNSAGAVVLDRATVTTSTSQGSFVLHEDAFSDVLSGAAVDRTWGLVASGGNTYSPLSAWQTAFSAARFLAPTFPAYVPSGSTVTGASFSHRYHSTNALGETCVYYQFLEGSTPIANIGSAASPYSCSPALSTAYVTDSFPVPQIDTVAEANNLVVRIYVRNSGLTAGLRATQHDLAELTVNYSN